MAVWAVAAAPQVTAQETTALKIVTSEVDGDSLRVTLEGPAELQGFAAAIDGASVDFALGAVEPNGVTVVFAVETSSSMAFGRAGRALAAAQQLIDALEANDRAGLVSFGDTAEVLQPPTTDHGLVIEALAAHEQEFASSLYSGVSTAFRLAAESDLPASVVVITLGWNFGGAGTTAEALSTAEASGAAGFVVALGADLDARLLDGVAALGGLPRGGNTVEELASIAAAVGASRGAQYELTLSLAGLEGGAHDLVISTAGGAVALSFGTPIIAPPAAPPIEAAPVEVSPAPTAVPSDAPASTPTEVPPAVPDAGGGGFAVDQLLADGDADPLVLGAIAAVIAVLTVALLWRFVARRRHSRMVTGRLGLAPVERYAGAPSEVDAVHAADTTETVEPEPLATLVERDQSEAMTPAVVETEPSLQFAGRVRLVMTMEDGERREFTVGSEPTVVGRSPLADQRLSSNSAAFVHSVVALDSSDGMVAVIFAADGGGPIRVQLSSEVSTDLCGCRFELPDGATAAA
jgi:hypothetical protein